jgi:CRP-like cAMP-binding protein
MNSPINHAGTPASTQNQLLASLPPPIQHELLSLTTRVELEHKHQLYRRDQQIEHVYFLEGGLGSILTIMEDGQAVEVGIVGAEGLVGVPAVLGDGRAITDGVMQIGGPALRLPAELLRQVMARHPPFARIVLRYVQAFHAQVSQTAACNRRHQIEERLARWLLMASDRLEGDLPLTQEFLATMLGVRRPGVTVAMGLLQKHGVVAHHKGSIRLLDRPGLERTSCECYAVIRAEFERLIQGGK